jgi:23S rRNA (cytidine1920-2'-O)/16S rRNA (cytidine1409-2'-O)-methyltransferase
LKTRRVPLIELTVRRFPQLKREEIFALILGGRVSVGGGRIRDPKHAVLEDESISIEEKDKYVSRGGDKLEHALSAFGIDVEGKVFIDAGSSTGGFTDCLLDHGAKIVHAVDVGYNQLDYELRKDPRVKVMERTNIMESVPSMFDPAPDAATCDLAFRSIRRAASHILSLTGSSGFCIALIKPQFEWENPDRNFRGVVPPNKIEGIVSSTIEDLKNEEVLVADLTVSPIRGHDGNLELLFLLEHSLNPDTKNAFEMLSNALMKLT